LWNKRHNGDMTFLRSAFVISSALTAACAFTASWYWYLSSRPSPETTELPEASIDDNPAAYIMAAQVSIYNIHAAMNQASLLNKRAALWSGAAAFAGAVAAIAGIALT
jgi:hypothetical protein